VIKADQLAQYHRSSASGCAASDGLQYAGEPLEYQNHRVEATVFITNMVAVEREV
jgi:hypothetical protein